MSLCTPAYATVQESMYMLFILFFFSTEVPPGVHNGVVHSWFHIDSTVASFPGSPPQDGEGREGGTWKRG